MNSVWFKLLVILIIFSAEALSIYYEIFGAKLFSDTSQPFQKIFWKVLPIIILAAIGLFLGYVLGIRAFENIWIVSVISIVSILILEPILAYAIFKQLPTRGALIGFMLGSVGFLATLFIK